MPGYRFCRPDDIPLLVKALNECFDIHFPKSAPETIESFKQGVRHLDIWASSCMIALEGEKLIGVCIGCKRDKQTLIYKIGVHPDFQRQGHASHLLRSLSAKLAVLGPPSITTEVPDNNTAALTFFEKLGFKKKSSFSDFKLGKSLKEVAKTSLLGICSLDELLRSETLPSDENSSWQTTNETLLNQSSSLRAAALAGSERIEAYLVFEDYDNKERTLVHKIVTQNPEHSIQLTPILLRFLSQSGRKNIQILKTADQSLEEKLLPLGFNKTNTYSQLSSLASPM